MQNGNLGTKSSPIDLSELSFAELAKLRREREASEKIRKSETPETERMAEQKQKIVQAETIGIELAENIDFDTDYFKLPNNIYNIAKLQDEKEHCVYMYLFRLSYGWKRNFCRVGYDTILKNTSLSSRSSVIRAVEGLMQKHHIIKVEENIQRKSGTLYRVLSPDEILSSVFNLSIVNLNIVKLSISKTTISKMSIVKNEDQYIQNEYSQSEYTNENKQKSDSTSVFNLNIVKLTPNKDNIYKDNLKDTLSPREICTMFYKGIGQEKISKQKRERAENDIKELLEEGFSEEDIAFAVKWTIKNSREKPYDFSLIKDTIGQAMAAKEQEKAKENKKLELEQDKIRKMEEEKKANENREKIKSYKDKLSAEQRSELRIKALDEVRNMKGIREEFITEILIEAKENEFVSKILGIDLSETT